MFALNLVKLFVAAVIIGVLWYGYKWISGLIGGRDSKSGPDALDMKECPVCNVYRSGPDKACEREDCPYR